MRGAGVWLAAGQCAIRHTMGAGNQGATGLAVQSATLPTACHVPLFSILRAGAVLDRSRIRGQPLRARRYRLTAVTKPLRQTTRPTRPPTQPFASIRGWRENEATMSSPPTCQPSRWAGRIQAKPSRNKHNHAILHRSILLRPCSKLARFERPTRPAPCTAA